MKELIFSNSVYEINLDSTKQAKQKSLNLKDA